MKKHVYKVRVYVRRVIFDKHNRRTSRWFLVEVLSDLYSRIDEAIKDVKTFIRIDRKQNALNMYKYSICVVKKGGVKRD